MDNAELHDHIDAPAHNLSVMDLAVRDAITSIEQRCVLITNDTSPELIATIRNKVKHLAAEARRVAKLLDDVLIARIEETRRDIELPGNIRLYVGNPPAYEVDNHELLFNELFNVCGGDMGAVVVCLASKWFKISEIRARFEQAGQQMLFARLVRTVKEAELKEGKPTRRLMEANGNFGRRQRLPGDDEVVEQIVDAGNAEIEAFAQRTAATLQMDAPAAMEPID